MLDCYEALFNQIIPPLCQIQKKLVRQGYAFIEDEKVVESAICSTITYLSWQNEALLEDFEWVKISISIQVGNLGEFQ